MPASYTKRPPANSSGIQPAELRHLGATPSLAMCGTLDPDHILHSQLARLLDLSQERLDV